MARLSSSNSRSLTRVSTGQISSRTNSRIQSSCAWNSGSVEKSHAIANPRRSGRWPVYGGAVGVGEGVELGVGVGVGDALGVVVAVGDGDGDGLAAGVLVL